MTKKQEVTDKIYDLRFDANGADVDLAIDTTIEELFRDIISLIASSTLHQPTKQKLFYDIHELERIWKE